MRNASYDIINSSSDHIIIRDIGAYSGYMSVTNAAEQVVAELLATLKGRRLFYYDSEGRLDELVIKNNKFSKFRTGGPK